MENNIDLTQLDIKDDGKNLLLDLPIEIFMQICTYLTARTIIKDLSVVCKHLNNVIKNDSSWKHRIFNRWPNQYPAVDYPEIDWKRACIEREDQYQLWTDFDNKMIKHSLNAHYGNVDCLHLMNEGSLCVSGARDHSIAVWDLKQLYGNDVNNNNNNNDNAENDNQKSKCCSTYIREGHKGWIWTIDSYKSLVASGSWDKTIAVRDLDADFKQIHTLKLKSAVLCQSFKENTIIAGSYDKKIYSFDLRASSEPTAVLTFHKGPIISLQNEDNFLLTAAEDKKVFVTDLRMTNSYYKKIDLNYVPMSMCYKYNHLWIGETLVHLYDGSKGLFDHVESIDLDHKFKVTGIQYTLGSLITCSKDRKLKFSEPTLNPKVIKTIEFDHEPGAFKFLNNTLAIANQSTIEVFIPNELNMCI